MNLRSVAPPLCIQGLIRHYSVNRLQRLPTLSVQTKVLLVVDKVVQTQRKQAMCVFLVMAVHVMTAHLILDTTCDRAITSLIWKGPTNGGHTTFV